MLSREGHSKEPTASRGGGGRPTPAGLLPKLWGTLRAMGTPSCPRGRLPGGASSLSGMPSAVRKGNRGPRSELVLVRAHRGGLYPFSPAFVKPNWGSLTANIAEIARGPPELGGDDSIPRKEPRGWSRAGAASASSWPLQWLPGAGQPVPGASTCGPLSSQPRGGFCCAHFTDGKTQTSGSALLTETQQMGDGAGARPGSTLLTGRGWFET